MSGNIANTYFANQLALRNTVVRELNEIDTGRIINVNSGQSVSYNIDDEPTPNNYELYVPLPGILQADGTTTFVINNPNNVNVEFRARNWFTGPSPILSTNLFPDFSFTTSTVTTSDSTITFKLYADPLNPSVKAWFKVEFV